MTHKLRESPETETLIERAENGDAVAIDTLFDKHLPNVKNLVRRRLRTQTHARFDASDVIQETHRIARLRLDDFLTRRPMPFRLWLIRTAN